MSSLNTSLHVFIHTRFQTWPPFVTSFEHDTEPVYICIGEQSTKDILQ